jgi:hypothetical protein
MEPKGTGTLEYLPELLRILLLVLQRHFALPDSMASVLGTLGNVA